MLDEDYDSSGVAYFAGITGGIGLVFWGAAGIVALTEE
jgi:hypothetical protein